LGASETKEVLQFDFSRCQFSHQFCGTIYSSIAAVNELSETRRQVDLYRFLPQKGVYGSAVEPGELLQFAHADTALSLLNRDESRSRYLYRRSGTCLADTCRLAS
jgi:hypothetical protein